MKEIEIYNEKIFEDIKHINEYGQEYWYGRELAEILKYNDWRNFLNVIKKAKISCENSGFSTLDHFVNITKMVQLGSGSNRNIEDIELSRYACYLIVQNADARKKVVALGQTYFAIQTRKQELIEDYEELSDNQKRISIRRELTNHNKSLADAAHDAGIIEPKDYAIFQNNGYMGLYGGLTKKDIHERKGLKKSHNILDYMGHEELAANLFRATQTESKLKREKIKGKDNANKTHYEVGKKVRQTIEDLGGTMPEDLPTPKKSIKQIEKEESKKLKSKK